MNKYELWFKTLMERTDDSFIIIDRQGIVQYINKNYCDFLYCTQEEAIGKPIENIIPNTSMYDVMDSKLYVDKTVWFQPLTHSADTTILCRRFCFFDEDGNVTGSMSHCKMRDRTWFLADTILKKETESSTVNKESSLENPFSTVLGECPDFVALKKQANKVAQQDFPIFLSGETGTGKEVFAHAIHYASKRKDGPFVSINCGAIPSELLESELFGYDEGAFTGAKKGGKLGKFELANKGTIFLDEIADLPLALQVKLLRVLQDFQIERVGGLSPVPVDVRVISATRKDLEELMEQGLFREDLYYRLNVVNLNMIPLRDRKEDIPLFARQFLRELNNRYSTKLVFSQDVLKAFQAYEWPGNIRELRNIVSSSYAAAEGVIIGTENLPPKISNMPFAKLVSNSEDKKLSEAMDDFEEIYIRNCLEKNNFKIKKTAEMLGIDRTVLWRKMKKYNINIISAMAE